MSDKNLSRCRCPICLHSGKPLTTTQRIDFFCDTKPRRKPFNFLFLLAALMQPLILVGAFLYLSDVEMVSLQNANESVQPMLEVVKIIPFIFQCIMVLFVGVCLFHAWKFVSKTRDTRSQLRQNNKLTQSNFKYCASCNVIFDENGIRVKSSAN